MKVQVAWIENLHPAVAAVLQVYVADHDAVPAHDFHDLLAGLQKKELRGIQLSKCKQMEYLDQL